MGIFSKKHCDLCLQKYGSLMLFKTKDKKLICFHCLKANEQKILNKYGIKISTQSGLYTYDNILHMMNGTFIELDNKPQPTFRSEIQTINENFKNDIQNIRSSSAQSQHKNKYIDVVGVTFKNDDGSKRQSILKKHEWSNILFSDIELEEYKYKGDPAVRVFIFGECIGNIPAALASWVIKNKMRFVDIAVFIDSFEDDYDKTIFTAGLNFYYD